MKKILFFILFAQLFSAQNPDLINTDWHILKYQGEQFNSDLYSPPMAYNQTTTFSTANGTVNPHLNLLFFNTIAADLNYVGQEGLTVTNKTCTNMNYTLDNGEVNQFFQVLCSFFNAPIINYTIQINGLQKTLIINNAIFQSLVFSAGVLSTKEIEASNVVLATNPVVDNLIIKNTIVINSYKIFDQSGKLIEEKKNVNAKNLNLNIQNFQTGVYFIQINEDKSIKFIKK